MCESSVDSMQNNDAEQVAGGASSASINLNKNNMKIINSNINLILKSVYYKPNRKIPAWWLVFLSAQQLGCIDGSVTILVFI